MWLSTALANKLKRCLLVKVEMMSLNHQFTQCGTENIARSSSDTAWQRTLSWSQCFEVQPWTWIDFFTLHSSHKGDSAQRACMHILMHSSLWEGVILCSCFCANRGWYETLIISKCCKLSVFYWGYNHENSHFVPYFLKSLQVFLIIARERTNLKKYLQILHITITFFVNRSFAESLF